MRCVVLYLLTADHLLHHAFMFRGVVAGVGGCEGAVTAGRRKEVKDFQNQKSLCLENQLYMMNQLEL